MLRWQPLLEQDTRASGQVCRATTSMLPPLVARCTFYLDLLYKLFEGEVCLQLCGAPYRLFTKGAMAGSWVLLHPTNTSFAERVAAVRQNNWLQHQGITKAQREHGFRLL